MSKSEEYQKRAEECQRMATASASDAECRAWVELAESWLRMILHPAVQPTPEQIFDNAVIKQETHQKRSDAAH